MKTYFYMKSAYLYLPGENEKPECFLKLDEYFDEKIPDSAGSSIANILDYPLVSLAENLCYRMADIDLYASLINDLLKDSHEFWSEGSPIGRHIHKKTILASSLLISYFGSCKSLSDAGAIALNQLYSLRLAYKEQDFRKPEFKSRIREKSQNDYSPYISLVDEIIKWRDCGIHRMPLTVMAVENRAMPGPSDKGFSICLFGKVQKGSNKLGGPIILDEVIKAFENDDSQLKDKLGLCQLLDPHEEWRPKFIDFCGLICDEIKRADFLKGCIN